MINKKGGFCLLIYCFDNIAESFCHSVSLSLLAHHLSNYWRMTPSVTAVDDVSLMIL
ncbi:hypothetical protein [Prevotella melaninogenica]|uniref:hypothetical protein n=1 Tax=Prevotella melaninogenica TaxID=28132 RepID=UPI0015589F4A|nr:hypothetical protein [Prevotella melaninogenica]